MTGRIETAVGEKTKIVAQGKEDADAAGECQSEVHRTLRQKRVPGP